MEFFDDDSDDGESAGLPLSLLAECLKLVPPLAGRRPLLALELDKRDEPANLERVRVKHEPLPLCTGLGV